MRPLQWPLYVEIHRKYCILCVYETLQRIWELQIEIGRYDYLPINKHLHWQSEQLCALLFIVYYTKNTFFHLHMLFLQFFHFEWISLIEEDFYPQKNQFPKLHVYQTLYNLLLQRAKNSTKSVNNTWRF